MKKAQVVKFWKALSESTETKEVISAFENKKGYAGKRTLERYAQAAAVFRAQGPSEGAASKTGWSGPHIARIRGWWEEAFGGISDNAKSQGQAASGKKKTRTVGYTRESLAERAIVSIPPGLAIDIPLIVEKGEAISLVQMEVTRGGTEEFVDLEVFDDAGKTVVEWDRNLNRAIGHYLLPGKYVLRLSNEFQPNFAKRVFVQVRWQPYAGGEPPPAFEFSDLEAEFS